ncbi:MAG: hypothetical protein P4L76_18040 [Beijerinckiaceae bacterium]|nr:hypothetical protein [Beijerinckiaceae bacterium]
MTTRPSHAALVKEVADELLKEEPRLPSAIARAILSLIAARLSDVTPESESAVARAIMDYAGCEDGDDGFRACVPATCSCRNAARAAISAFLAASALTKGDAK